MFKMRLGSVLKCKLFEADKGDNVAGDNTLDVVDNQDQTNVNEDHERKFSQKEVNAMINEKKQQTRSAMLKNIFGVNTKDEAEEMVSSFTEYLANKNNNVGTVVTNVVSEDTTKLAHEVANVSNDNKDDSLKNENKRLNYTIQALKSEVNEDACEYVVDLAMKKVDDNNTFEDVLEEMKNNKVFASMFKNVATDNNTGGKANPKRTQNNAQENLGAVLGKKYAVGKSKENPYYK